MVARVVTMIVKGLSTQFISSTFRLSRTPYEPFREGQTEVASSGYTHSPLGRYKRSNTIYTQAL